MMLNTCNNRSSRMKMPAKILKKLKSAFKHCHRPNQSEKTDASTNATDEQKLWSEGPSSPSYINQGTTFCLSYQDQGPNSYLSCQDQAHYSYPTYPSYEEIMVTDSRESIARTISTIDSGVNISNEHKEQTRPYTVTVEAVIEAKPFLPHCYSTPNSLNSESNTGSDKGDKSYKEVNYSTYTKANPATLERAIQNVNAILTVETPTDQYEAVVYENFDGPKTKNETEEKFIVNLFESRPSKRWQRRLLSPKLFEKDDFDRGHAKRHTSRKDQQNNRTSAYSQLSKSDEMYLQLKKIRDAECVKMNQASNALMTIKTQKDREWNKELVAEKILLECDIRNKLIVQKIRELKCPDDYSQVYKKRVPHKGSITVSNFEFDIKMSQDKPKKNTYTDFYVLALSYGTTLHMSNIAKVNENKLVFKDTFILKDLEDNFGIKAELFTLRLKTKKDSIRKICRNMFKKTTHNCCTNKIYYEDLNLNELLQSDILTPSFTHCLQFMLTKNQIDNGALFISPPPESKFRNYVNVNVAVNKLDLDTDLSGFLTWGTKRESIITWERKWVSLKGTQFSVYNYPQDEEYERDPCQSINLQYCLLPLVKEVENCPRKRTFVIKTGRPSTFVENEEEVALKKRYNFVLEKFYISADNNVDYKKWTETLESSLDTMRDWKQLVFIDDYYTK